MALQDRTDHPSNVASKSSTLDDFPHHITADGGASLQEEVFPRFPTCRAGLSQLLSQVTGEVPVFPGCFSCASVYQQVFQNIPVRSTFCSFIETWEETGKGGFLRKTALDRITNQAGSPKSLGSAHPHSLSLSNNCSRCQEKCSASFYFSLFLKEFSVSQPFVLIHLGALQN